MKALNSLKVCKHHIRMYMELVAILRIVPKVISIWVAHQSATNFLRISLTKVFCRIGHTRAFRRTFLMKSLAKTCLPTGLRIRRSLPFWLRLVRISASTPTKMHWTVGERPTQTRVARVRHKTIMLVVAVICQLNRSRGKGASWPRRGWTLSWKTNEQQLTHI